MTARCQLLVRHRGLDPTAWTALHALAEGADAPGRPAALARAVLWDFAWDGEPDLARHLADWVAAANWFANPNRDRVTWRQAYADPTDLEVGAALASGGVGSAAPGAFLVTAWRGGQEAAAHAAAAFRALGCAVSVHQGQVWWLAAEGGDPASILLRSGGGADGGLLVNRHSQVARLCAAGLPVPALPLAEDGTDEPADG
jgi:hypothetical protein